MGEGDEGAFYEPISQEDYEKETIITAIDEWGNENGNGDGNGKLIPDTIPKRGNSRYILFIIMGITIILEIVIGIYLFTKIG
jgi:hypothetical protein